MLTGSLGGVASYDSEEGNLATGVAGGIAAGTLLPLTVAKLITSPKFVNWLTSAATERVTSQSIGASMARLATIAEKNEDIRPAIYEYMATFKTEQQQ